MEDAIYREIIMEHAEEPHNAGTIDGADMYGEEVNPTCGDEIRMYLKLEDGKVVDVKHDSKGCAVSQASVSMLTDMLKGKTEEELKSLTKEDVLELLGISVSTMRLRCALLSLETLRNALGQR